MKYGLQFTVPADADGAAIRAMGLAVEKAGFDNISVFGHVLGAANGRYPERPPHTYVGPFHDPFVLFSYLAAITKLEFFSSILILPLLSTGRVAKQTADLSRISDGRFHLGVGISWNPAEYKAMGREFANRAIRMEEQITLLRKLWSEPYVTFEGKWHSYDGLGINMAHVKPAPIWVAAGQADAALKRVAKMADGWLPIGDQIEPAKRLKQFLAEEGRDPSTLMVNGRLMASTKDHQAWLDSANVSKELGVTHLTIQVPPGTPADAAFATVSEVREVLGDKLD
jgi:probable F420-dependent oxidoreductase